MAEAGSGGASAGDDAARRQIRGSSLLFGGRLISVVANMVVQVLLVRSLGQSEYGAFAYALSIVSLAQVAVTLGVDRALPRFLAVYDETGDRPRLAGTVLLAVGSVVSFGLVVVLIAALAGRTLVGDGQGSGEAAAILAILIFLAPIRALEEVQLGILATFARPRAIFVRRYVLAPVLNLVVVGLLVFRHEDAGFLAAGYVVAGALGLALSISLAWTALASRGVAGQLRGRDIEVPWGAMFGFALPLITTDALYLLINASDAIFLNAFHGTDAVAQVRAIVPVATLNSLVMTSFTPLFTPLAARLQARDETAALDDLYWQTALWIAIATFPVVLVTVAFAEPITVLLFGRDYAGSAPYLIVLSVGYYVNAALGFNGLTVRILGRLRVIVVANAFAAGLNIALNLLLVPQYGPIGAVIATTATLLVHNLLKQLALRGTGVGAIRGDMIPVYALLLATTVGVGIAGNALPDDLAGGAVLAAVTAVAMLAVWLVARRHLRIAAMFPEVRRLPFARQLFSA
jgi:O-antigen/teichoic acid export membrane protein